MENIFDLLAEDDLTPDLQMLANVCGIDTVKTLLLHFAGINFYIPKISRLDGLVSKYIARHAGRTHNQIAQDLKVSGQFIKKLMRKAAATG